MSLVKNSAQKKSKETVAGSYTSFTNESLYDSSGNRYKNCLSDGTGFMWNVQLERGGTGFCYDSFDSNGLNVPIQIRGQPVYNGTNDTYYNVDADGTIHPPQIQMWLYRDTYFYL